ncbi:MAG: lysyl-tRNA synthetase, class [Actinomycetota bacterium]|nr:lysyl-tRNA synthetase, class [Actinomycetota bacterium]MDQ1294675.1 lysyl-tRNA synthetase, class [Actinomycetota bacterium]
MAHEVTGQSNGHEDRDWVDRFASELIAQADRKKPGQAITCASGLSPSGPVHLGNLREVMTPHLVADEVRRRGRECVHVLSWDDFDRFRKVPAGVDPSWNQHIGKPLSRVPAPAGSEYPNWAEHFKAPMRAALAELGVTVREVSQTSMYTSGAYREQIFAAMAHRHAIDAILDQYRTKGRTGSAPDPTVNDAEALAIQGSGASTDDDGKSTTGYFPYKPFCSRCDKDLTTVTHYDDDTTELHYVCNACSFQEAVRLDSHTNGKLVWKVDWPMRWAFEDVDFEPSGVDHSSPGSSYVVGKQIVRKVFHAEPPIGPMYAFVGISGMAKMSSSRGAVPTPSDALKVMEAPVLRWLYARRRPNQSFKVAFDGELARLYDEWDAATRRKSGQTAGSEDPSYGRALNAGGRTLTTTPHTVPFRTLASIVDVTAGDTDQVLRILRQLDPQDPVSDLADVEPRLSRASYWINTQVPLEERTQIRDEPDKDLLAQLSDSERETLTLLVDGLDSHQSLEQLTTLVYAAPKIQAGLPVDVQPTPELKAIQRKFFSLVYRLLVTRDTGPRLPTLLISIGTERAKKFLTP